MISCRLPVAMMPANIKYVIFELNEVIHVVFMDLFGFFHLKSQVDVFILLNKKGKKPLVLVITSFDIKHICILEIKLMK